MYSCTMPVPGPGGPGGTCPHPHEEDVSVLFFFLRILWVEFGVVSGVSMDRTTVMLTDQIRKRVCLAL